MITALAVERVEFTCGHCWHRWSAHYDVQRYVDDQGQEWESFHRDNVGVASPYTFEGAPPCPYCERRWVGRIVARRPAGPQARRPAGPQARRPAGPQARRPAGPQARPAARRARRAAQPRSRHRRTPPGAALGAASVRRRPSPADRGHPGPTHVGRVRLIS
ncbi:hypothetical protein [Streptomyces sp. NPDC002845]